MMIWDGVLVLSATLFVILMIIFLRMTTVL